MDPNLGFDPVSSGWQTIWMALGGGVIYAFLDLFVLNRNASFGRRAWLFRGSLFLLVIGVLISANATLLYAQGKTGPSSTWVTISLVVRGIGVLGLVMALFGMVAKKESA